MPTIGEIKAEKVDTILRNETEKVPQKFIFGVFFDGTFNNMIYASRAHSLEKRLKKGGRLGKTDALNDEDIEIYNNTLELNERGANTVTSFKNDENDFSNVAILHSYYQGMSSLERKAAEKEYKIVIHNIYVEGVGTEEYDTDDKEYLDGAVGRGKTGIIGLVGKTMEMVQRRINAYEIGNSDEVIFDVVGFSRGATCARMFAYAVQESSKLYCDSGFPKLVKEGRFLKEFGAGKNARIHVEFLGIFDTVSSVKAMSLSSNVQLYGLFSPTKSWVKRTFHIAALDEFRDNFKLTDIGDAVNTSGLELFMPGCHSDIGGGYITCDESMRIKYSKDRNINILSKTVNVFKDTQRYLNYRTATQNTCYPIDKYNLKMMGWYAEQPGYKLSIDHVNSFINITRHINGGYGNIALDLMKCQGNRSGRTLFDNVSEIRFNNIPEDLQLYYKSIKESIGGRTSGRIVFLPDDDTYKYIRSHYIHFSASEALVAAGFGKSSVVMAPSVADDGCITRIVYEGNEGKSVEYDIRHVEEV